ncbi:ATP-dependent DNA helicase [Rothia halotolerans]|uniref:ATP-dependent DNA helicase n=1 Tax=Rothia halotolerans TaxID=405770 RepID=UPI001EDE19D9|nr:ATP-dependent DNA helicase [Rothia halotolerans]
MSTAETAEAPRPRISPEEIARALGRPLPTAEQSAIISAGLSPRLVVAGAGSGKTATMVDRVVWLVVNGLVRPEEVLGVTFTTKAAGELRHRMSARLAQLAEAGLYAAGEGTEDPVLDPTVSTYHSYAKSLVAEYGLRIGIERDVTQLGQAQCYQLAAQIVENWDGVVPERVPAASTLVGAVLQLSGECAEHLREPGQVYEACAELARRLRALPNEHPKKLKKEERARNEALPRLENKMLVAQLTERYQRVKKAMQVMDFGDLLADAATLARTVPAVGREQRQLYRVVLLDEFQDTSHAQMVLFSQLFGGGHSVMAVGDPKQSIYGFRGASEGQLFDFYEYFPSPDPRPGYLTVAWRNGSRILGAANLVAHPLAEPLPWARSAPAIGVPDLVERPEPEDGRVLVGTWETETQEAEAIVERILRSRTDRDAAGEEHASAAVLCRARRQLETVRLECERAGLPYELVGLGGLLETPEVLDVVATLRVLSDPSRSDALMRLLAGARWRIGPRDLMALNDWAVFLARRRRQSIVSGMAEDLETPEGEGPGEEGLAGEAPTGGETAEGHWDGALGGEASGGGAHGGGVSESSPASDAGKDAPAPEAADGAAARRLEELLRSGGGEASEGSSLVEAIETLPRPGWVSAKGRGLSEAARERLERLAAELDELRGYLGEDLTSLLYHIERVTLLDVELASKPGRDVHTARANLDAFYQAAAEYCASAPRVAASLDVGAGAGFSVAAEGTPAGLVIPETREHRYTVTSSATGVTAFLAWLEAALAEEGGLAAPAEAGGRSAVQLLTIHGSKGLEWDEVYLHGMNAGTFPTDQRDEWIKQPGALPWPLRGDAAHLPAWDTEVGSTGELQERWAEFVEHNDLRAVAEERRLAYVALTRARSRLMLGSSRWTGAAARPRQASPFLREILEGAPGRGLAVEVVHEEPAPEDGAGNPQAGTVLAALWPFDPLTRPHVSEWEEEAPLDALAFEPDAGRSILDPGPALSRRAEVEAAARLVEEELAAVRAGDAPGEASSRAGEEPGQEETAAVEPESEAEARAWAEETELLLGLRRERAAAPSAPAPPTHVSASLLVGLAEDPEQVRAGLRRPMPRRPAPQARAGTRFHEWVEEHFGSPAMLDLGEVLEDADEGEEPELARLQEAFRASPWYQRQPWAVEFPLETPVAGFTVRGRIDAVFRDTAAAAGAPEWELVDWKTGRVPIGARLRHRAVQLAVYRLGFARLMDVPLDDVAACFHYVAENRTVRPPRIADEEELTALLGLL